MNLSLDYAVRYLQLNESLIVPLNYYVDNRLFHDGQNHINTLDIPPNRWNNTGLLRLVHSRISE